MVCVVPIIIYSSYRLNIILTPSIYTAPTDTIMPQSLFKSGNVFITYWLERKYSCKYRIEIIYERFFVRVFTLFSKSLPLDVVSRIWDVYFRDGDSFLFAAALGTMADHCNSVTIIAHAFIFYLTTSGRNYLQSL